ncbi:hypothetical protein Nepgr_005380 [Nepenthes gracilis]|uniref:Uncharacterized protein n=1 Tax=Nepenthes gracilis TaxID=150966 RepID=A0AAD3XGJ5_NEPGR|nr:hypothetical protein Nepgr_005380 [Nepenthes gracilis]
MAQSVETPATGQFIQSTTSRPPVAASNLHCNPHRGLTTGSKFGNQTRADKTSIPNSVCCNRSSYTSIIKFHAPGSTSQHCSPISNIAIADIGTPDSSKSNQDEARQFSTPTSSENNHSKDTNTWLVEKKNIKIQHPQRRTTISQCGDSCINSKPSGQLPIHKEQPMTIRCQNYSQPLAVKLQYKLESHQHRQLTKTVSIHPWKQQHPIDQLKPMRQNPSTARQHVAQD